MVIAGPEEENTGVDVDSDSELEPTAEKDPHSKLKLKPVWASSCKGLFRSDSDN